MITYYLLNTNERYPFDDTSSMLNKCIAAAYGKRKEQIERIKSGDVVFLYQNKVGIIAYGFATGDIKEEINSLHKDGGALYQILQDFKILKQPMTIHKMRELAACGISTTSTLTIQKKGANWLEYLT